MTEKEAKSEILEALKQGGRYMNNIIGSILRQYSEETSTQDADKIVIDMDLERLVGIPPMNKEATQ